MFFAVMIITIESGCLHFDKPEPALLMLLDRSGVKRRRAKVQQARIAIRSDADDSIVQTVFFDLNVKRELVLIWRAEGVPSSTSRISKNVKTLPCHCDGMALTIWSRRSHGIVVPAALHP